MTEYFDLTRLLERLHRRYLDVVRLQLSDHGIEDVNPAQALMLVDIGDGEIATRDLMERGYYLASAANYNIRRLVEAEYVEQTRSARDKRQVKLKLTDKGRELAARLSSTQGTLPLEDALDDELRQKMGFAVEALRDVERIWFNYIAYK